MTPGRTRAHRGGGVGWRRAATGGRARSVCRRKVWDRANQTRLAVAPFGIWQSLVIACRSLRGKSARLPAMESNRRDRVALAGAVVDGGRVQCRVLDGLARDPKSVADGKRGDL